MRKRVLFIVFMVFPAFLFAQDVIIRDNAGFITESVARIQLLEVAETYGIGVVFYSHSPTTQWTAKQAEGFCRSRLDELYYEKPAILIGFIAAPRQNDFLVCVSNQSAKDAELFPRGFLTEAGRSGLNAFNHGSYDKALSQVCDHVMRNAPTSAIAREPVQTLNPHVEEGSRTSRSTPAPIGRNPFNWGLILLVFGCAGALGFVVWMWWTYWKAKQNMVKAQALESDINVEIMRRMSENPLPDMAMVRCEGFPETPIHWLVAEGVKAQERHDAIIAQLRALSERAANVRAQRGQESHGALSAEFSQLKAAMQTVYDELVEQVTQAQSLPKQVSALRVRLGGVTLRFAQWMKTYNEQFSATGVIGAQKMAGYIALRKKTETAQNPDQYKEWHVELASVVPTAEQFMLELDTLPDHYNEMEQYIGNARGHRREIERHVEKATQMLSMFATWRMTEGVECEQWHSLSSSILGYFDSSLSLIDLNCKTADMLSSYRAYTELQSRISEFIREVSEMDRMMYLLEAMLGQFYSLGLSVKEKLLQARVAVQDHRVESQARGSLADAEKYFAEAEGFRAGGNLTQALASMKSAARECGEAVEEAADDIRDHDAEIARQRAEELRRLTQIVVAGSTVQHDSVPDTSDWSVSDSGDPSDGGATVVGD